MSSVFSRTYTVPGVTGPVTEGTDVPYNTRGDISVATGGHSIVLQGDIVRNFTGSTSGFSGIRFLNGDSATLNNIPTYQWQGGTGASSLQGRDDGSNVFIAAPGTISLMGGAISNTYLMGHGDGSVSSYAHGTSNVMAFKPDVTMSDVHVAITPTTIGSTLDGTTDGISMLLSSIGSVYAMVFSDGTVWTSSEMAQLSRGDTIGTTSPDVLEGANTTLMGMGGPDNYIFRPGETGDLQTLTQRDNLIWVRAWTTCPCGYRVWATTSYCLTWVQRTKCRFLAGSLGKRVRNWPTYEGTAGSS